MAAFVESRSPVAIRFTAQLLTFALSVGLAQAPTAEAATECLRAGFALSHTVRKPTGILEAAAGGVTYEQRQDTGAVRILNSRVGFAAGNGAKVDTEGQGTASNYSLRGNITRIPKAASVVGSFVLRGVPGRGAVPVHLEISVGGLRKVGEKQVNGQRQAILQGTTSYLLTDAASGAVLSRGKARPLSRLRTFQYQWTRGSCGGGTKR